jgi:malate synthase
MEDAATAEISRAQLWQWLHVGDLKPTMDDATRPVDCFDESCATIRNRLPRRLP